MADENVDPAGSRTPTTDDLIDLCRHLNRLGARYLIVGGFAVIQHGYFRSTGDIDVLIEDSLENQKLVREALKELPEKAILELGEEEDLRDWVVLRVADEFLVDVMTAACGVGFGEAESGIQVFELDGVPIPMASAKLLLRMKQTYRSKDEEDRVFLRWKIGQDEARKE